MRINIGELREMKQACQRRYYMSYKDSYLVDFCPYCNTGDVLGQNRIVPSGSVVSVRTIFGLSRVRCPHCSSHTYMKEAEQIYMSGGPNNIFFPTNDYIYEIPGNVRGYYDKSIDIGIYYKEDDE